MPIRPSLGTLVPALLGAALGSTLWSSCCCKIPSSGTPEDALASIAEEYGHASVSTPLLSLPDDRFEFGLDRPALDYFKEAKTEVQGGAALFRQIVQSLQAGVSVQMDPTQTAAYSEALSRYFRDRQRVDERQRLRERAADDKVDLAEERVARAKAQYDAAKAALDREEDETKREELQAKLTAAEEKLRKAEDELIAAKTEQAESRAPENESAQFPTASSQDNTPEPAEGVAKPPEDARGILAQKKFKDFGELLQGLSPTVSNRTAIITSAGDKAVEAIFRVLGKPNQSQQFKGRAILFGIAMVSVNPGWRTRRGFAADISVQVEMGLQPVRPETRALFLEDTDVPAALRKALLRDGDAPNVVSELRCVTPADHVPPEWGDQGLWKKYDGPGGKGERIPVPLVAAVSPMTETQTLDLAASFRRRDELALRLALALRQAGLAGQAEVFEQFVKDRQRDIKTRNAIATVSSYSVGHMFGYQVGPRLHAIADATSNDSDAGYLLSRQTFPVLLIIGLSRAMARPQILPVNDRRPSTRRRGRRAKRRQATGFVLAEPYISFTQSTQWVPLSEHAACQRLPLDRLLKLSARLRAPALLASPLKKNRVETLKNKVFGSFSIFPVPLGAMFAEPEPKVLDVLPKSVSLALQGNAAQPKTVKVTVIGKHLDRISSVELATGDATLSTSKLVGDSIQVEITVKSAKEPLLLMLRRSDGRGVIYAPPITVKLAAKPAFVRAVQPSVLEWTLKGGKPDKKQFEVLLHGANLSRVDLGSLQPLQGKDVAKVVAGTATYDSGSILVKLEAEKSGTVTLQMALANSGIPPQTILSPPITVRKKPEPGPKQPGATKVVVTTHTGQKQQTRTVTIPAGGDPAAVDAAKEILRAEIEKNKPASRQSGGTKKQ